MADWFRSTTWTPEDAEQFELRLGRARPHNRAQYLRIQGVHLEREGLRTPARELWRRALAQGEPGSQRSAAMEHLAGSLHEDDPEEAERLLRALLEENPPLQGTSQLAHVELADLLAQRGTRAALREARSLLRASESLGSSVPIQDFRRELVRARVHHAGGQRHRAAQAARSALAAAGRETPAASAPGLAVQDLAPELEAWLRSVAETGCSAGREADERARRVPWRRG
ncbi:tetratricopeptide repeat protein [Brachybacterium sp. ACRRE]|uniref:tetratricopeptide repeat protein n=1 Tax=Brachybacterium sp. ACRRE TaxID=2918184 RepID=UPI001EF308FA|nr:tetratricopeptide repeat protein [Brachybacterium sp. ACRRE]MCG7309888.1 tetratricopeptide repeat protein [Brachybacterium sp. ACRRE]